MQGSEDKEKNATKFVNINPFEDDEELCNYEANEGAQ